MNQPGEQRYRTINSSKAKLQSVIFSLGEGAAKLFLALGFIKADEDRFVFELENVNVLRKAIELVE